MADAPSKNYPFAKWCRAKGFTTKTGYVMISKGLVKTFLIGLRRFVTEEADQEFDAATRGNTKVELLRHSLLSLET